ncbi:MAG: hypothetical protein J2P45_25235, partial [Candidatus Dormibacteraeota bacterium]|nr:hypothetical protein [Candidatus Dormibacteraeota bacterium]
GAVWIGEDPTLLDQLDLPLLTLHHSDESHDTTLSPPSLGRGQHGRRLDLGGGELEAAARPYTA